MTDELSIEIWDEMTDKLSKISVWILSLARPLLSKIFIKVEEDNGEGG